jgi:predicted ArsR family transcriptional regulator
MGKDRAAQKWTRAALVRLVTEVGRYVSAGELAQFMQISRNTAAKRLAELRAEGEIEVFIETRGRVTYERYCPLSNKARPVG